MAGDGNAAGYRVDEFDVVDPGKKFGDNVRAFHGQIDAGRGDEIIENMRRDGVGAGDVAVAAGLINSRKSGLLKGAINAGKTAHSGAVKSAGEKRAGGLLAEEYLAAGESARDRVNELEGRLEDVLRQDDADGTIPHARREGILYRLGRIGEMEELCETWEGSRQDRDEFYVCMARILRAKGDADAARMRAVAVLTLEPREPSAFELLGDILADAGDLRGAVLKYNESILNNFNYVEPHVKKAKTLLRMGRPDSAALARRRGLEVRPADERLHEILKAAG